MSSGAHCHYCGVRLTKSTRTRDHVIPRSKGGSDAGFNIVLACPGCNVKKGDTMPGPIAHCEYCEHAMRMHRIRVTAIAAPRDDSDRTVFDATGTTCPDCGRITMFPAACTWCATDYAPSLIRSVS